MADTSPKHVKSIKRTKRKICGLCHEEREIRLSHIIPEFFYKKLYDKNHNFLGLSQNPAHVEFRLAKGLRETLLCAECELKFSKYEDYACRVFYGGTEIETSPQPAALYLKGVDYKKFRLFLLSLLWRMSIAETSFFSDVELGPFEERIRRMLFEEDPGEPDEFWCRIISVQHEGKHWNWSLAADLAKYDGHHCYRMIIDGFLFLFFVSKRKPPAGASLFYIKKDTTLVIAVEELMRIPFLADTVYKMGKGIMEREARERAAK